MKNILTYLQLSALGLLLIAGCTRPTPPVYSGVKMKGVNLVAPSQPIDSSVFTPIRRVNAEWVAVVPYGFCREGEPHFYFNMREFNFQMQFSYFLDIR